MLIRVISKDQNVSIAINNAQGLRLDQTLREKELVAQLKKAASEVGGNPTKETLEKLKLLRAEFAAKAYKK